MDENTTETNTGEDDNNDNNADNGEQQQEGWQPDKDIADDTTDFLTNGIPQQENGDPFESLDDFFCTPATSIHDDTKHTSENEDNR